MSDIDAWLSTIDLTDPERTETFQYITQAGFTLADFHEFTEDFAKEFFSRDHLPTARIVAIFRIRKAIVNIKDNAPPPQIPNGLAHNPEIGDHEEEIPQDNRNGFHPPPQHEPIPQDEQPLQPEPALDDVKEDEEDPGNLSAWSTETLCEHIKTCNELQTIKPDTMEKILSAFREIPLDGREVSTGNVIGKYAQRFKIISLGGRHKLRKVLRRLTTEAQAAPKKAKSNPPPKKPDASPAQSIPPPQPKPVAVVSPQPVHESPPAQFVIPQQELKPPPQPFAALPQMNGHAPQPEEKAEVPPPPLAPPIVHFQEEEKEDVMQPPSIPTVFKRRWYWYDDNGVWYPYDDETSGEIEGAWSTQKAVVSLSRGSYFGSRPGVYVVKFDHKEKIFYQVNNTSQENRPVLPNDSDSFREFARMEGMVEKQPKESATEFNAVPAPFVGGGMFGAGGGPFGGGMHPMGGMAGPPGFGAMGGNNPVGFGPPFGGVPPGQFGGGGNFGGFGGGPFGHN